MSAPETRDAGGAATPTGVFDHDVSGDQVDHTATPPRRQLCLPLPSSRSAMAGLLIGGAVVAFSIGALAGARSVECDCTTVRWEFVEGRP